MSACCMEYGTAACQHESGQAIRAHQKAEQQAQRKKGHTANGTYVCPIHPVAEFVKLALGKPVHYLFAEKLDGKVRYYTKRVR